ncbi:MAG: HYR domain-containing protein [Chloroflexi bacterium]|nr:HYR domain-containing protein [Chloroflexota bacterium]
MPLPAVLRRALTAVAAITLLTIPSAFAETVTGDADIVAPGIQGTIDLGTALPGQDVELDVAFVLECSGTNHVDARQSVRLSPSARSIPAGGSYGVASLTIPIPAGWPADGEPCPAGIAPGAGSSHIIVTAPPTDGTDYRYTFSWSRSLVPSSATDGVVFEGTPPSVVILLDVSENTPPSLVLPGDMLVEGDTTGGATAAYSISATDTQDATPPIPVCDPGLGSLLPLGTTTVNCSATDGGGLTTTGSFEITVVDTTAPVMPNLADYEVTTSDPAGTTFYLPFYPAFVEAVDPAPTAVCLPADGTAIQVGTTTVTCTASDASGNHSSMSFDVLVTYVPIVPPVEWSAVWGEPVATTTSTFTANTGRNVPVKVEIFADGVEQASGDARLSVTPCGGGTGTIMSLNRGGGVWGGHLATALLGPGCYVATATLDGNVAGSIRLILRGAEPASASGNGKSRTAH